MSNALQRAMGEVDSMRASAKAAVANIPGDLIGAGPMSDGLTRADMSKAKDQYEHFRGWAYAAIRPIAQRIAGQPINVGRVSGSAGVRSKGATKPDPLPSHPILDLLSNPNNLLVGWSLMYSLVASLELTGREFLWVTERNGQREAYPLPTSWIEGHIGQATITHWGVRPEGRGEAMSIPADAPVDSPAISPRSRSIASPPAFCTCQAIEQPMTPPPAITTLTA